MPACRASRKPPPELRDFQLLDFCRRSLADELGHERKGGSSKIARVARVIHKHRALLHELLTMIIAKGKNDRRMIRAGQINRHPRGFWTAEIHRIGRAS